MSQPQPNSQANESSRGLWVSILLIFAVFLLVRYLSGFLPSRDKSDSHPAVGRILPMLELQALTPGLPDLELADLQDHVTLLNFWGTWCLPCRTELPHIAELHQKFGDRPGFRLVAVSCGVSGRQEDLEDLQQTTAEFLETREVTLPTYADLGQTTRRAVGMAAGDFPGYPTTLLIDQDSVIRGVWSGYRPAYISQMEKRVQELLAERAGESPGPHKYSPDG